MWIQDATAGLDFCILKYQSLSNSYDVQYWSFVKSSLSDMCTKRASVSTRKALASDALAGVFTFEQAATSW